MSNQDQDRGDKKPKILWATVWGILPDDDHVSVDYACDNIRWYENVTREEYEEFMITLEYDDELACLMPIAHPTTTRDRFEII